MATVIDSLLITIGVDPSGVQQGIQTVDQALKTIDSTVKQTAGTLTEGLKPNTDTSGLQKLGAETQLAESALREADATARRVGDSMSQALKKPGEAMQGTARLIESVKGFLGGFIAPLAGAVAIGGMFGNFISQGTQLSALSSKLGRDVRDLDAWGAAVEQAGGSASAFQSTLDSFDKGMREAAVSGGGGNLEMLYLLGIRATDARGKLRSLTDILPDLAKRIEGMSNARSRTILEKMGLDDGTIMLLQKGGKAVEDLMRDMRDFAFTKRDTDAADAFSGAMSGLKRAGQSVANVLFRELVPIVVKFSDGMKEIFRFLKQHEPFILSFFAVLTAAATRFLLAWAANPVVLSILAIIAVIGALALVIDDLYAYTQGGGSRWKDFWSQFGTGEEIAQKLSAAWEALKEIGKGVFEGLKDYARDFFRLFDSAIGYVKPVLDLILGFGRKGTPELRSVGKEIASMIAGFVAAAAVIKIVGTIVSIVTKLGGAIQMVIGVVKALTLAMMANPVIAILTVLIGLTILIAMNWDTIKAKVIEWGLTAAKWIDEVKAKAGQMWEDFKRSIPAWEDVKAKFASIGDSLKNYFKKLFSDLWESLLSGMPDWTKKLLGLDEESKKKNQEEGLAQANLYNAGTPIDVSDAARRQKREDVMGQITAQLPHNYGAKQQAVSQALSRTENKTSRTDINSSVNVGTVNITAPDGDAQAISGALQGGLNNLIPSIQSGTIR